MLFWSHPLAEVPGQASGLLVNERVVGVVILHLLAEYWN